MTISELNKLILQGESSTICMSERVEDVQNISAEMAAFSNSKGGGKLLIGINKMNGSVNGLSFEELQYSTELLFSLATQKVNPSIIIATETVVTDRGNVLVVSVAEGKNKPYRDEEDRIWIKNSSKKTQLKTNVELASLMQSCGSIQADKSLVEGCTFQDLNKRLLAEYLIARFPESFEDLNLENRKILSLEDAVLMIAPNMTIDQLLVNLGFMNKEGGVFLATLLLFGECPQQFFPWMTALCTTFAGKTLVSSETRNKKIDVSGCLSEQYSQIMAFLSQNLCVVEKKSGNDTLHAKEIPFEALHELVVNALVHRDYFQECAIRIFLFDDRLEIHTPGALPFSMGEERNLCGVSKPRNFFLFNNANVSSLRYTGVGCGFSRAFDAYSSIEIADDRVADEVVVVIELPKVELDTASLDNQKVKAISDIASDIASDRVGDIVEALTDRQKKVLEVCLNPQGSREILKMIEVTYHPDAVKLYIRDLIELGYLYLTIPEKPTSPKQRYYTTDLGKNLLSTLK